VLLDEWNSFFSLVVPLNKSLPGSNIGAIANFVLLALFDLKDLYDRRKKEKNSKGLSHKVLHSGISSSIKLLPDLDEVVDPDLAGLIHEDDSKLSNIWNVFI